MESKKKKKTNRNREQIGGGAVKCMKLVKGVEKYNPSRYKKVPRM